MEVTYQQPLENNQTWRNISVGQQRFTSNNTENRTNQMMGGGGEGGQLHIEPFVHIEREENEEGGEKMNNVDEGNLGAHAQTEMGKLLQPEETPAREVLDGDNVIKASKTIDEALNEIDDSYWKAQQSKENQTKLENRSESTSQFQDNAIVSEKHSEANKLTMNNSAARKLSENKSESHKVLPPIPWADHNHEAVNRTVKLIKQKNKELKIGDDLESPALERAKREGIPVFLDNKGGSGLVDVQKIGSGSGSGAVHFLTSAMFSALFAMPLLLAVAGLVFLYRSWHLRAEAKKRFSVDTELAPPFLTQIVVENDYGGKVAIPLAEQLGYMTCYANNNNNGPRKRSLEKEDKYH